MPGKAKTKVVPHRRREGGRLDPEALDAQLLARGLGSEDLAKLTGLDLGTVGSARRGERVRRGTVMKIVDILAKVPIRPEVAILVGVAVPAKQNGEAKNKKTGAGANSRRSKEISRDSGQP